MGWVQIIAGLYYSVGTGYLLSSWLGSDEDYARPNGPRPKASGPGDYGFLQMQAGLIRDQAIDELTWSTRIPYEFKMRRNEVYWEQNPQKDHDIEMSLRIRWYDLSGINEVIRDARIDLIGQKGFMRVDLQDMYPKNDQHSGEIKLLPGMGATAITKTVPTDHPTYFDVVQPRDMTFGALEDIELTFKAKLYPRGATSWKTLRAWFDPLDPQSVQLGTLDAKSESQEIRYDYW